MCTFKVITRLLIGAPQDDALEGMQKPSKSNALAEIQELQGIWSNIRRKSPTIYVYLGSYGAEKCFKAFSVNDFKLLVKCSHKFHK